jgi:hypothetical protein
MPGSPAAKENHGHYRDQRDRDDDDDDSDSDTRPNHDDLSFLNPPSFSEGRARIALGTLLGDEAVSQTEALPASARDAEAPERGKGTRFSPSITKRTR